MEGTTSGRTVVGYPRPEGVPVAVLVSTTPPSLPRVWPLAVALVLGLHPLLVPFAVWAAVDYWRRPLSRLRWRVVSVLFVALGVANIVGFLVHGYGRHYGVG